eukprot:scaffold650947_cov51-Prasinocladus_malaysianus.AAC.1
MATSERYLAPLGQMCMECLLAATCRTKYGAKLSQRLAVVYTIVSQLTWITQAERLLASEEGSEIAAELETEKAHTAS